MAGVCSIFEQILEHMPETEVDVVIKGMLLWWVLQLAGDGVMQASLLSHRLALPHTIMSARCAHKRPLGSSTLRSRNLT